MKDPAFLFYSQDFIVGVQTLNWEDRGKYITLLAQMHQQGRLTEESICFMIGTISDALRSKFSIDQDGRWYNERLENETNRRNKYTESRRNNAKSKKTSVKAYAKHMPKHMENEDENENVIEIKYELPFGNDFALAWDEWIAYRKEIKKKMTSRTIKGQLKRLSTFTEPIAVAMINQSIENGWTGLFELKPNYNGKQKTHPAEIAGRNFAERNSR